MTHARPYAIQPEDRRCVMPTVRAGRNLCVAAALALALAGCAEDLNAPPAQTLWPAFDGTLPRGPAAQAAAQAAAPAARPVAPTQTATATAPAPSAPAPSVFGSSPTANAVSPSGTHVGLRIARLQQDLQRLQNSLNIHRQSHATIRPRSQANASAYQAAVAPVYARLQVGTTPGNPELVQLWNEAELRLSRLHDDVDQLNSIGNAVAADASLASYLLDSVRATYGIAGAFESDHRQLSLLEDETGRTVTAADRLLTDISGDINRQGNYVAAEHANMTSLALALKTGSFFQNQTARTGAPQQPSQVQAAPVAAPLAQATGRMQPGAAPAATGAVAVVRFDGPRVAYDAAVQNAVRQALARNPAAAFDVIGYAPARQTTAEARKNAESVYRSVTRAGVPAERVNLSATTGNAPFVEVHIFQR